MCKVRLCGREKDCKLRQSRTIDPWATDLRLKVLKHGNTPDKNILLYKRLSIVEAIEDIAFQA